MELKYHTPSLYIHIYVIYLAINLNSEKECEIIFLDPTIGEGKRLVNDKSTPISHLYALLRQFITPVCQNIGVITEQASFIAINFSNKFC